VTADTPSAQGAGVDRRLGATLDASGARFCVATSVATGVELCLLDDQGRE